MGAGAKFGQEVIVLGVVVVPFGVVLVVAVVLVLGVVLVVVVALVLGVVEVLVVVVVGSGSPELGERVRLRERVRVLVGLVVRGVIGLVEMLCE